MPKAPRKIIISIELGNAAFDADNGGAAHEVARILRRWADRAEESGRLDFAANVFDSNGNRVGTVKVS